MERCLDRSDKTKMAIVDAIKKHPILYTNMDNFKNNPAQYAAAWQDVTNTVCPTASIAEVRERWKELRVAHGRFLKTGFRKRTPGFHERMSFLNAYISVKETEQPKVTKLEDSLQYAIKLVCYVRQNPALYKKGHVSARPEAWESVASQLGNGETAEDCRTRWSKLRMDYIYYLKKGYPVKPKGITSYLAFLKPFVNIDPAEKSEEFAAQLIDLVRQYPPLFNGSPPMEQTAVWEELAQHMGNDVAAPLCIAKWTKLRDKYERHLKTGSQMIPCGLEHHLRFLDPFILKSDKGPPKHQLKRPAKAAENMKKLKELQCDTKDPDTAFLLQFLVDMAKMSDTQKRLFKLGAVKASLNVLDGI